MVLAVEKRATSPLMDASSLEKIAEVTRARGIAVSGLTADGRGPWWNTDARSVRIITLRIMNRCRC